MPRPAFEFAFSSNFPLSNRTSRLVATSRPLEGAATTTPPASFSSALHGRSFCRLSSSVS